MTWILSTQGVTVKLFSDGYRGRGGLPDYFMMIRHVRDPPDMYRRLLFIMNITRDVGRDLDRKVTEDMSLLFGEIE